MNLKVPTRVVALLILFWSVVSTAQEIALPQRPDSVRFAVFGDSGTGDTAQYEVAAQMVKYHQAFAFTFSLMLGDNMYGSERPQDFEKKFERPYKTLLDAKVDFYAVLGNHDDPNQRFYKPFNMNGQRYYSFKKGQVRFFALDSNYMEPEQIAWLEKELQASGSDWKIPLLPSPPLLIGHAWITNRVTGAARASLHQVRCRRGVCRTRTLLRAHQAAARHLVFHVRRCRQTAQRRHSED